MMSFISKRLRYKLERQEVVKGKNRIWLAEFVDGRRNQSGFAMPCPCTRELQREPPHLWQPLRPDGENLEHWAGAAERREVREWRKEGKPEAQ